jgi:cysteine-S-conjugate beta-lyase
MAESRITVPYGEEGLRPEEKESMKYDFDQVIERRNTDSMKWRRYPEDVIPLWVADMDFAVSEPVVRALHERLDHKILGYSLPPGELKSVIRERLKRLYRWDVREEEIVFAPGMVTGLNVAFQAFAQPGDGVLVQPPVYFHFLNDPVLHRRVLNDPSLVPVGDTYGIDFGAFEKSITERTRLFVLCNPHNPVGRAYRVQELEKLAEICLSRRIPICSDEIHCDLLYPGYRHIPIASLAPEIADRTITLMAASKTFNLAGLSCGFAIIPNQRLRSTWETFCQGLIPRVNIMGHVATLAALKDGQEWLDQVIAYLTANRDFLVRYIEHHLPSIRMARMEATYLAWLDCRNSGIPGNPFDFFLREARVALNDGREFGKGGEGFVRLNFASPRKILTEALERMESALRKL